MDPPLSRSTCTHNVYPSTYTCTCTHNVYVHTMYILPHNYTCTYTCTCTCIMISTTTIFRGCTCLHAINAHICTVEPPKKDPPRRRHYRNNLQNTCFKVPNVHFPILLIYLNLWRVDNVSTKSGPNMTFVQRFDCINIYLYMWNVYNYITMYMYIRIHTLEDDCQQLF